MPALRLAAVALATILGAVVPLAGCDDAAPAPAEPVPSSAATSSALADLDTAGLTVLRAGFCDRVPAAAVAAALDLEEGTEPAGSRSWANGDRVRLADGVHDVAHEYGCRWRAGPATASAWVFAPPVTPAEARDLRAGAVTKGCVEVSPAPGFGAPGVALRCGGSGGTTISFRGLFGDAWLTCTLQGRGAGADPDGAYLDRAGRWCAAVVQAAAA